MNVFLSASLALGIGYRLKQDGIVFVGEPKSKAANQAFFGDIFLTNYFGKELAVAEGVMGYKDSGAIDISHFAVLDKTRIRKGTGTRFAYALAVAFRRQGYSKIRFREDTPADSPHSLFFKRRLGASEQSRLSHRGRTVQLYWEWPL